MKATNTLFMILPPCTILFDSTIGYNPLLWVVESLNILFIPQGVMVLIAAIIIVMLELVTGSSDDRRVRIFGLIAMLFIPMLIASESFNKLSESRLLEMPVEDTARIVLGQSAVLFLALGLHAFLFYNAKKILGLYSGEEVPTSISNEPDTRPAIQHSGEELNNFIDDLEADIDPDALDDGSSDG